MHILILLGRDHMFSGSAAANGGNTTVPSGINLSLAGAGANATHQAQVSYPT
jgi:hypothetical protein